MFERGEHLLLLGRLFTATILYDVFCEVPMLINRSVSEDSYFTSLATLIVEGEGH